MLNKKKKEKKRKENSNKGSIKGKIRKKQDGIQIFLFGLLEIV